MIVIAMVCHQHLHFRAFSASDSAGSVFLLLADLNVTLKLRTEEVEDGRLERKKTV